MGALFYVPIMCVLGLARRVSAFLLREDVSFLGKKAGTKSFGIDFRTPPFEHPQEGINFF